LVSPVHSPQVVRALPPFQLVAVSDRSRTAEAAVDIQSAAADTSRGGGYLAEPVVRPRTLRERPWHR